MNRRYDRMACIIKNFAIRKREQHPGWVCEKWNASPHYKIRIIRASANAACPSGTKAFFNAEAD
jgi:hypothetical protein